MRFADVTASALVTRGRAFGNELGEAFVQPARNSVGVKAMQDEMDDFVPEKIVAEFVGGISLDEEAAGRMNSAGPRL